MVSQGTFQVGDLAVYCAIKHSCKPGVRAKNVSPAPRGETYTYRVDKYWVVDEVQNDGTVVLRTRRGKTRAISVSDPNLRRASLWEKFVIRHRFPVQEKRQSTARTA